MNLRVGGAGLHPTNDAGNNRGQFVVFFHTKAKDSGNEKGDGHATEAREDGPEVAVQSNES